MSLYRTYTGAANEEQALQRTFARRAYAIWLAEGKPLGKEEEHMRRAKEEYAEAQEAIRLRELEESKKRR
jgi:hypothetical protein